MSLEIHSKLRRCGPLLLAGVLMVNSLPIGALAANIRDFKDVDGHWAYNALDWAVENGVMTGTSEDTMSPDGFLTRAQMATMIDRLYGAYKGADISAFTDVAMGSWYYDYIAQAVQMGTLAGYDGNIMRPNDHITREQAIVVIARALCLMMEYDEDLSKFSDAGLVGSWAYADICRMVEREFVAGYPNGALGPKDNITRAQLATILARFCDAKDSTGGDHFTDIATHWARQNINTAAAAGLVQGYGNGTFRPDNKITRAETVGMINRILGRNASAKSVIPGYKTFSDIKETDWFYWDIIEAANTHRHDAQDGIEKWTKLG